MGKNVNQKKYEPSEYELKNPTNCLKYVEIREKYVNSKGKEESRVKGFRPEPGNGYDILTDDVLGNGNLKQLRKFQQENQEELNQPENYPAKLYMDERIRVAEKLEKVEQKGKEDAAIGRKPPQPQLDEKDGFVGFSNLAYPEKQTSYNGCWSCSISLMLKSRGVDLTQEEIRGWRPDYPEGTPKSQKLDGARIRGMNTDRGSTVFENSDVISTALPNTSIGQVMVEPFSPEQISIADKSVEGGSRTPNKKELNTIKTVYREQTKELLQKKITEALTVHRSPVALAWDGHYVTVTGIKPDGTLRLQDSLPAHGKMEQTITMENLLDQGLFPHKKKGTTVAGTGLQMCWLSDLPTQEYGDKVPPDLNEKGENYAKLNQFGSVTVEIPKDDPSTSAYGNPTNGQVRVTGSEKSQTVDASDLAKKLGVEKVSGWGQGGNLMFASESRLYPKKMVQYGEPELVKAKLKNTSFSVSLSMPGEAAGAEQERYWRKQYNQQIKPYEDALKTLGNAAKGWKGDCAKLPEAIETLKGLPKLLKEKQEGCDRTNYELLQEFPDSLKFMKEGLESINRVVDIGFDSKELEREIEQDKKLGRAQPYQDKLRSIWKEGVDNLYAGNRAQERKLCIAKLIAADSLWKQDREKGVKYPNPSDEAILDLALNIAESPAFQEMTAGIMSSTLIDKNKYNNAAIDQFENTLADINKRMAEKKAETDRYAVPEERREAVRERAKEIAKSLDASGTGSYTGAGIISRRKNSDEFEKAKKAIRNTGGREQSSPKQMQAAVKTVLSYLDGKEKVRKRQFGRDRWNACMNFLSETMPRADFEKYCDKVNKARGVGPDSPDCVGPENFIVRPSTTQDVTDDAARRAERGEATLRDYARIVAARKCAERGGQIYNTMPFGAEDLDKLRRETDAVMADPQFREFIESTSKEEKEILLGIGAERNAEAGKQNGALFDEAWKEYQKNHPVAQKESGVQKETEEQKGHEAQRGAEVAPSS